jgi:hypothetical protein
MSFAGGPIFFVIACVVIGPPILWLVALPFRMFMDADGLGKKLVAILVLAAEAAVVYFAIRLLLSIVSVAGET